MLFLIEHVREKFHADRFTVDETDDGRGVRVRLSKDLDGTYDKERLLDPIVEIMRAALALQLHPDQIEDHSTYRDDRRMGSSWTGEYGSEWVHYDVTFLYRVPPTGPGDLK